MIEMRKVVDITDLPEDIKRFAYDYFRDGIQGNNSYISHWVSPELYEGEANEDYTIFDKFLLEHGCNIDEKIILLYWW